MSRKLMYVFLGCAALLAIIGVILYVWPAQTEESEEVEYITTSIPVMHQWRSGVHTYVGTIQAPTPCHTVSGQAIVSKTTPAAVEVRLETRDSGEVCVQVIAEKKFRVSFAADKDAVVKVYLNSTPILFAVTEAPLSVDLTKETI